MPGWLAGMRILFTGGSGKAGRHVAPFLADQGHQVTNADLVPLGRPGVADLRVDLTDTGATYSALAGLATFDELDLPEKPAYDAVVASGRAEVVYLPDNPKVYRVTGRDTGNAALLTTLVADGVLVVLVGLFLLLRHRLRPELQLLATGDLETSSDTDGVLERIEGQSYRVRGAVATIEDDEVVLEVGDRRVRVHLDGHHNPAGHQEGVEVRGTMVG